MSHSAEKVRENRVRQIAERQSLMLKKSRRRDPRAWDYGRYGLVDADRNALVFPNEHGASLDDMETYLTSG